MQPDSTSSLREEYLDDEDAEGESDDEGWDEESSDDSGDNGAEDTSSGKGKEKEKDMGELGEVEMEVDQDFDRLVHDLRSGDLTSGTLSKVWDFDMRDREAEFKDDLREASGVGKKRGRKPGRRKGIVLSQQVRGLIGEGNQAYVDNNIPETIRVMQEVIRIEPRAGSAWSVLAQCYEDTGELQKALQLRIMAAHLNKDPEEWYRLADQSRRLGYHQQALYCYRKLYQVDPTNITALWDRASLAREIGDLRTARHALLAILKHVPHDLSVLTELRPVLIELNDLALCAELFQGAFTHYQTTYPLGHVPVREQTNSQGESSSQPGQSAIAFGLMEILVLADLCNTLGNYEQAIHAVRQGCRWMQGRAAQRFWDAIEDDREWDIPDNVSTTGAGEGVRVVGEGEIQPGVYLLDVNARHRLAVARIKMGDVNEGRMHANIVLGQDIAEYAALFSEIADAYFDREMYADAGHIYEILGGDAGTSSLHVLLQAAACRRMMGDLKEAAEVYEHVIKADPTHNDAKMKLAEIYEILNDPRKALDLVLQVIDSRRRTKVGLPEHAQTDSDTAAASLFEEKPRVGKEKAARTTAQKSAKLSITQLKELEAKKEQEAVLSYGRVKILWAKMLAEDAEAEREWMHEAESLVESFRETRALFLTSRHTGFRGVFPRTRQRKQNDEANEDNMASRLQLELGRDTLARKTRSEGTSGTQVLDSFRKISFDDWLRLFMQYAFILTKRGQYDDAQDVLRHVSYSNAFQKRHYQDTIRYALITCSIQADRPDVVVEQSRKLINTHQYNNEPLRLLLASLSSGLRNTDAFLASTLSKHLLREVRSNDAALKNPETLKWNPILKRYGVGGSKTEDDEDDAAADPTNIVQDVNDVQRPRLPTKENPIGVALYGQICLAAKSYQSALFYLLHAYDYCPHDPMICLCLAIASVGRAMQRQADNRHHMITQGLAFLSKYRTIRGEDDSNMDEVEYNFGRVFHQLGLLTLAVKHYTRVLKLTEERLKIDPEDYGIAREAAYNLSSIYVTTGATPLAQALYRQWLSL